MRSSTYCKADKKVKLIKRLTYIIIYLLMKTIILIYFAVLSLPSMILSSLMTYEQLEITAFINYLKEINESISSEIPKYNKVEYKNKEYYYKSINISQIKEKLHSSIEALERSEKKYLDILKHKLSTKEEEIIELTMKNKIYSNKAQSIENELKDKVITNRIDKKTNELNLSIEKYESFSNGISESFENLKKTLNSIESIAKQLNTENIIDDMTLVNENNNNKTNNDYSIIEQYTQQMNDLLNNLQSNTSKPILSNKPKDNSNINDNKSNKSNNTEEENMLNNQKLKDLQSSGQKLSNISNTYNNILQTQDNQNNNIKKQLLLRNVKYKTINPINERLANFKHYLNTKETLNKESDYSSSSQKYIDAIQNIINKENIIFNINKIQ